MMGIIKVPEFIRLTDGVINSIRSLGGLKISHITHFFNYSNLVISYKNLTNRLILNISNNPQEYSILLQKKIISKYNIEDYRNIKEIRVKGNNDPLLIQQDVKNIIKNGNQTLNHQYYPF
jgi:hypothetical protein